MQNCYNSKCWEEYPKYYDLSLHQGRETLKWCQEICTQHKGWIYHLRV